MNCSTCSNWDTCKDSKMDSESSILEDCFEGTEVIVDKLAFLKYVNRNKSKYIKSLNIVMFNAVKDGDRMFNIKCLELVKSRGCNYICKPCIIQAYYSSSKGKYSIYKNGLDLSMSRDRFTQLFNTGVSDEIVAARSFNFCN